MFTNNKNLKAPTAGGKKQVSNPESFDSYFNLIFALRKKHF